MLLFVVLAKYMADVLAQETFNALAKLLNAINVFLVHLPIHSGAWMEGGDFLVDLVIPRNVCHQVLN